MKQLEALQASVVLLLKRAQLFGKVMIITNAETGWVELSAKRFMPEVVPYLADLDVFSARSHFEALAPDSPSEWKVCGRGAMEGGGGGGGRRRAPPPLLSPFCPLRSLIL